MLGEVECPDLTAFFQVSDHSKANRMCITLICMQIFILNRSELSNATTISSAVSSTVSAFLRRSNTLATAQSNVSAHYDISNDIFVAFLSRDMTYSCPIWKSGHRSNDPKNDEPLEYAQIRKLDRIIENAKIKGSDHVLEIGTGWGSFAIRAVERTGCRVTSLTLSREQKDLADRLIADAGFANNIEVLLCDYRALPMPREGPYDKIISIEMIEAVGQEYLVTYFECIHRFLKSNGGIAVLQCITMPESKYNAYARGEDFIQKYIFPGGHLPTVSQLVQSINKGSKGLLVIDAIENIGPHYAKTLRIWRQNFEKHFDSRIRPVLLAEHQGITESEVALFRRKWQVNPLPPVQDQRS